MWVNVQAACPLVPRFEWDVQGEVLAGGRSRRQTATAQIQTGR